MGRELERKFEIRDKQAYIDRLRMLGIYFSKPINQQDIIFLKKGKKFADLQRGEAVIRIRKENKRVFTTIKRYINGVADRLEAEMPLVDVDSFCDYLFLLDFVHVVTVNKKRSTAMYKNAIISLDDVEKLGIFTEIEIVSAEEYVAENNEKLKRIIFEFGLDIEKSIQLPYDEMIYRRENND